MARSHARPRLVPGAHQEWTRRRLQVVLGIAVLLLNALVAGAVLSVTALLRPHHPHPGGPAGDPDGPVNASRQDALAAAPLPRAQLDDAQPGPLSTEVAPTITLPAATRLGPADVPTGFPPTPAGALAQLAALDRAALEPGQVAHAQAVSDAWAAPGGPTAASWSGVAAVATLLGAAGLPASGAPELQVRVDAAMGFIKGSVGKRFVIPCVDLVITVTTATAANTANSDAPGQMHRVAAADCQRMVWARDRWVIGPGAEPAPAPSLWPGSQASIDAGYRWLGVPPWTG